MSSRATILIEPMTARLQAFTIEACIVELEKELKDGASPLVGGQPAGSILRAMAANIRDAADRAEKEFKERVDTKAERKQRREQRRAGAGFMGSGEDFATGQFGVPIGEGAGGGQAPPGVPPMPSAEDLRNKDFNIDDSI